MKNTHLSSCVKEKEGKKEDKKVKQKKGGTKEGGGGDVRKKGSKGTNQTEPPLDGTLELQVHPIVIPSLI